MLKKILNRIHHGNLAIPDPLKASVKAKFRGFPELPGELNGALKKSGVECPTGALNFEKTTLDLGKCVFCGECEAAGVRFETEHRTSACKRERLVVSAGEKFSEYHSHSVNRRREIEKIFGRSLKLRQVSAGGCNACEMELNACGNVNFDIGRYGVDFVASPRHADGLVITGPITKNMAAALEDAYMSTPDPKIVVLAGACAISGGVFAGSAGLERKFLETRKIDLYIPGCPVHPLTVIDGIIRLLGRHGA